MFFNCSIGYNVIVVIFSTITLIIDVYVANIDIGKIPAIFLSPLIFKNIIYLFCIILLILGIYLMAYIKNIITPPNELTTIQDKTPDNFDRLFTQMANNLESYQLKIPLF